MTRNNDLRKSRTRTAPLANDSIVISLFPHTAAAGLRIFTQVILSDDSSHDDLLEPAVGCEDPRIRKPKLIIKN